MIYNLTANINELGRTLDSLSEGKSLWLPSIGSLSQYYLTVYENKTATIVKSTWNENIEELYYIDSDFEEIDLPVPLQRLNVKETYEFILRNDNIINNRSQYAQRFEKERMKELTDFLGLKVRNEFDRYSTVILRSTLTLSGIQYEIIAGYSSFGEYKLYELNQPIVKSMGVYKKYVVKLNEITFKKFMEQYKFKEI